MDVKLDPNAQRLEEVFFISKDRAREIMVKIDEVNQGDNDLTNQKFLYNALSSHIVDSLNELLFVATVIGGFIGSIQEKQKVVTMLQQAEQASIGGATLASISNSEALKKGKKVD